MRDINVGGQNRGPVRQIIPVEQAKKYVAPPQPIKREYFEPKTSNSKKYLALGLFISLLLISIIFFLATFAFDGATITIKPLKKETPISETFIVSSEDRKELLKTKTLSLKEDITIPKKTVRKIIRKAEGVVTIYNNFSNQTQKFVKGTRLATADGKIFKIVDSVTVPGKTANGPGSVEVAVEASEEGQEYNIAPTKFTIPGFKGSPKYKDFYAESKTTMKGGVNGNVNDVSDLDLQKGIADLKTKLVESAQAKMGSDIPVGFAYNKDSISVVLGKYEKTAEDDVTATYSQMATATTLFFKRDDIVKKVLEKQNSNDNAKPLVKVLDTSKFEVSISNFSEAIKEDSQVTLNLTGVAPAVYYPNKQQILEHYAGRPVSEFNDIAKTFQFIESAERVIYPFWNNRFPTNFAKIEVVFSE